MKKAKLSKDLLVLLILTLITVLTWVGFAVWESFNKTTISQATMEQIAPLNPKINKTVLESLKKAFYPSEEEMAKLPLQTPLSTPSAELEQAPEATGSSQNATESAIQE